MALVQSVPGSRRRSQAIRGGNAEHTSRMCGAQRGRKRCIAEADLHPASSQPPTSVASASVRLRSLGVGPHHDLTGILRNMYPSSFQLSRSPLCSVEKSDSITVGLEDEGAGSRLWLAPLSRLIFRGCLQPAFTSPVYDVANTPANKGTCWVLRGTNRVTSATFRALWAYRAPIRLRFLHRQTAAHGSSGGRILPPTSAKPTGLPNAGGESADCPSSAGINQDLGLRLYE